MKWCGKMYSCVQRGVFSSQMAIVKWRAETVYHNQKEKETKSQASRQFDLVLQSVGVGPFLPKCILPLLVLSYSVHVPFHRSTCEETEWADIELMPPLCSWEEAAMLGFLAGNTFLWQSLTCTQHLMASWEAAHSLCTRLPLSAARWTESSSCVFSASFLLSVCLWGHQLPILCGFFSVEEAGKIFGWTEDFHP